MLRAARLGFLCLLLGTTAHAQDVRPNILWITSEDNGPHLGAYGDAYAITPNLDALAARGVRYLARVVHRARLRAGTHGDHLGHLSVLHWRRAHAEPRAPARRMRMFPALLREAGYYTSNNEKEDYNLVKAGRRLGRLVEDGALEEPEGRAAVLRRVQHHRVAREPGAAERRAKAARPR